MSSNPVYSFFFTPANPGPFFLRMAVAWTFFYHGTQKAFGWFGGHGWASTVEAWSSADGLGLPYMAVGLVVAVELLIAVGLFLGFLTRLGGLAVVLLMIGAIMYVHGVGSYEAIEYQILLLVAGLTLLFTGGGWFSVDRGISSNLLPSVG